MVRSPKDEARWTRRVNLGLAHHPPVRPEKGYDAFGTWRGCPKLIRGRPLRPPGRGVADRAGADRGNRTDRAGQPPGRTHVRLRPRGTAGQTARPADAGTVPWPARRSRATKRSGATVR